MFIVHLLLVILVVALPPPTRSLNITGCGVLDSKYFFNKLIYEYDQQPSQPKINFHGTYPIDAEERLTNNDYQFVVTYPGADTKDITSFPLFAQAFSVCYNLPDMLTDDPSTVDDLVVIPWKTLNFTQELIYKIFTGNITHWDDEALLAVNPAMRLYNVSNQRMQIIMRQNITGPAYVLNNYLAKYNPQYPYTSSYFPAPIAEALNATLVSGENFALYSALFNTNYSISFAAVASFNQFDISLKVRCGNMLVNGTTVSPTVDTIRSAVEEAVILADQYPVVIPTTKDSSWPITSFCNIYLDNTTSFSRCSDRTQVLKFFRWYISSPAHEPLEKDLYIPVPSQMIHRLLQFRCRGKPSLIYTYLSPVSGSTILTVTLLSFVLFIAISVVCIYLIIHYETTIVGKLYNVSIIGASSLCFVSVMLHSASPVTPMLCQSRLWAMFLSLSVFFGIVFSRNVQLNQIFQNVEKGVLKKKINNLMILLSGTLGIIVLEIIFLAVWTVVDPLVPTPIEQNPWELTFEDRCQGRTNQPFFATQFTFLALLLCFGIYVVYGSWNIRKQVDDARMIAMSIYVALAANLISFLLLESYTSTSYYIWAVAYTVTIEVTFCFSIFIPKLVRLQRNSKSSSSSSASASSFQTAQTFSADSKT